MNFFFLGFCFEGGFERVSLNAIVYSATSSPDVDSLYIHIAIQLTRSCAQIRLFKNHL
jgi:hypothetical protein